MLKWFSNEESGSNQGALAPQEAPGSQSAAEVAEQLAHTQQLVVQLKELIREKDSILQAKDEQLKTEKASCEAKLSKMRLQNKAKVTSLNCQLEDLKKQLDSSGGTGAELEDKKSGGDREQEQASASRGKILLLRKRVEELEHQLSQREAELAVKTKELEAQMHRGFEMDAMLADKDRKLAEKEAYIVDIQMSVAGEHSARVQQQPTAEHKSQSAEEGGSLPELQLLVQNLTRKVGESEERYSLLQEQTESLKELLVNEKTQFEEKENMYKQNIQTFKDIILQKDNKLIEINQQHEQELFRLAAKSDASTDLEQLLKALKQKLHEKEEVLLGKTQVIDVLQGEVDTRDQQIKELLEKMTRLQGEKDNMQSKLDAEKHVMRAQLRDLMEKHRAELSEKERSLHRQLEELRAAPGAPGAPAALEQPGTPSTDSPGDAEEAQKLVELEAQVKLKAEEASKSETKFLKMKAWSKSRIRQLEEDLRRAQSGDAVPDVNALQSRIIDLEEDRQELLCKLDQYDDLKTKNDQLIAKLVLYEEQQRKMQADLEQVTKRAASQTSESGSADELQSQVLEWQDMVLEAESGREQLRGEKAALALRMSHIEEEREALANQQQELEEELVQARGLRQQRARKPGASATRSLQDDFEFDEKQPFRDPRNVLDSTASTEGENMGGWWPEYSTSDTGLRSVVEELELERNHLQEQILGLEERCQDLEDRLQMQARIESLQTETGRLQAQLASLRCQQSREAEKHQLLVASLNEQLKGLTETQGCLEASLVEKEHTLVKASEKLEHVEGLRSSLKEKEKHYREAADKLVETEHTLTEVTKKCGAYENQCSDLRKSVADLTQKISVLKDKTMKQEDSLVSLQSELEQTNDELDKLNSTHLEERAQLIHDLQSCEREIDSLKEVLADKDKEISVLSNNMTEYAEQVLELKREIRHKEEDLVRVESALRKAEREAQIIKDFQSSDQQVLNTKITEVTEQLKTAEFELDKAKEQTNLKTKEVEDLVKQVQDNNQTIQNLRGEVQKLTVNHRNHLLECESQISSLKELVTASSVKLQDSEGLLTQIKETKASNEKLKDMLHSKEQTFDNELKSLKEERNQLLAEASKHTTQLQVLSKQLEEHMKGEEQTKKLLDEKLETIIILEQRLKATQGDAENERVQLSQELKAKDSDNEKLQESLQNKSEIVSELEISVKALERANQELNAALQKSNEELCEQKKLLTDLNEKNTLTLKQKEMLRSQVDNLLAENDKLQREIADKDEYNLKLKEEQNTLYSKISACELQHSENQKCIDTLQKDKEELTGRIEELKALEQSKNSISESLLEKSNECNHLRELLSEGKESKAHLENRISVLNAEVEELKGAEAEKDRVICELNANSELLKGQLEQLRESLLMLQDQSTALKTELLQKESRLQQTATELNTSWNEVLQQKEISTGLQAECAALRQSFEEQGVILRSKAEECEKYMSEFNLATEAVTTLRSRIDEMTKTVRKLESANVDTTNNLGNQRADNGKLKEQLALSQTEVKGLQNHVKAVSEENQELHAAIDEQEKELQKQKNQLTELQERCDMSAEQISENKRIIQALMKEKDALTERTEELTKVIESNRNSLSESLLEKTNECILLAKLLDESKQSIAQLNNQIDALIGQVEELRDNDTEKDRLIKDQNANIDVQRSQLSQLQEALSLLQEQGTALKAGLMEKDTELKQKDMEVSSLHNQVQKQEQLYSEFQKDVKAEVGKHIADNNMLRENLSQKQVELAELQNHIQVLNEVNSQLKTDHQSVMVELFKKTEEIIAVQSELSNKNDSMNSLKNKVTDLESERENLHISLLQKTEYISQQETSMKQLKVQLEEDKSQVEIITELQSQMRTMEKSVEGKERSFEEKEMELIHLRDKVMAESDVLKTQMSANVETISRLQSELRQALEKISELHFGIREKEAQLKQKVDDYLSLKVQFSELEDTALELKRQVASLTSEAIQLKEMLKEKEEALTEMQNTSLTNSDLLNRNFHAKDAECESLKERISVLQEHVSKMEETMAGQSSEIAELRDALMKREATVLEQAKDLQTLQRKADEAVLFKAQFMESTELVSELQSQIHKLTLECKSLNECVEEKQSALSDLQHKDAFHLQELDEVKKLLSQKHDEVASLSKITEGHDDSIKATENVITTLKSENSLLRQELQHIQASHADLLKQKEDALATHQIQASALTVEIERLMSQHIQVAAQVNALTENLEQREMALHAINNQYTAQVKHAEHLVSEMQKVEEQNKMLREELTMTKDLQQQLDAGTAEKEHLQQEIYKHFTEKEDLVKSQKDQFEMLREELQLKHQRDLCNMCEAMEKVMTEKDHLQVQVSASVGEISGLKLDVQKMTQTLQESEKEWLSVLDREVQEKNLLTEQLKTLENEMKSKDVKVQTLQRDLDNLQEKCVDVMATLKISSEELKDKELEVLELSQQVSGNKNHLEEILSVVHKKEKEIIQLDQALKDKENEVKRLELNKNEDLMEFSETLSSRLIALEEEKFSLQSTIKQLKANHQLEADLLKKQLDDITQSLQEKQHEMVKKEEEYQDKDKQLSVLQDHVKRLQGEVHVNHKNLEEAHVNQSSILAEIQKKDYTVSCMSIQLSQQKELLAALSEQLKEKDTSVTQVMVSASNEMLKHTEEKNRLLSQLETLEDAHNSFIRELENVSLQLQESKAQLLLYQGQMETKDSKNKELVKENDQLKDQYVKIANEKEMMKKKLHAALIVRKDLMKKISEYEKQRKDTEGSADESIALEDKLKDLTLQVQTTTEDYECHIGQLKQQMVKKDDDIRELSQKISAKDGLLEQQNKDMHCLQAKFSEQQIKLTNALQLLNEKCETINDLQDSIAQKEETFDQDRRAMAMNISDLKEEMIEREESFKAEMSASHQTSLERENELAVLKKEKSVLEKKVHAALIARKETMKKSQESERRLALELSDLKEEFSKLKEQHSKQTNECNVIQLRYDGKAKELEDVQGSMTFLKEEFEAAKNTTIERENMLHSLSSSAAERQGETMSNDEEELKSLHNKLQMMMSEIANKDALIIGLEDGSKQVSLQLEQLKVELDKANAEMKKMKKLKSQEQEMKTAQEQYNHDKQAVADRYSALHVKYEKLQTEVEDLRHALEATETEKEHQSEELNKLNKELLRELEGTRSVITGKALELQDAQNALRDFQLQFCQEREFLKNELEILQTDLKKSQSEMKSNKLYMETLEKEKEDAFTVLHSVRNEVSLLKSDLDESEKLKESLLEKLSMLEDRTDHELNARKEELQSLNSYTEELEASIKEKENGLYTYQTIIIEKEQLVASLEKQLQKEVHLHEAAMEQMKTVVNELQQTSKEVQAKELSDESKAQEQITRKLQAALISRKEVLKENRALKEDILFLKSENEEICRLSSNLEKNVEEMRKCNNDLEKSVSALCTEKEKLLSEVDRILNDNHNLSAACESLKLTIENITHEKQAFSCQLESLKDSQTVELSEWKSKHTELKQEYESLLQAYENVSSEMDKMRQFLEGARKEKQEVLLKSLQVESEKVSLEKQVGEAEEERERLKEKMRHFTKSKQQKVRDLEEENEKIRKEFQECGEKQKSTIENLTIENTELQSEINSLRTSTLKLEEKLNRFKSDNSNLSEELKVSNTLLDKWHCEAKASQLNVQLKLEEALNLNSTLTSKIEAQKADIVDKKEMIELLQKEKSNLAEINLKLRKDHEAEVNEQINLASKLTEDINRSVQEMSNLNEKIKILEDDRSLLQEELENAQEVSEKVKSENEYLETLLLKNAEKIDELTEAVNFLQAQNTSLCTQLNACKEEKASFCRDKEQQQLKLVKDFEEKLKVLQRGSEGSKSVKKELQELLKEKHQEVNQLQHDCIKYQELILELERSVKSSQAEGQMMDKELKRMNGKVSGYEETIKNLDTEVILLKNLLNEAKEEITKIIIERDGLKEAMKRNGTESQIQIMEKETALEKMKEEQKVIYKGKVVEFENQISELQALKERDTETMMELQRQIESQDLQIKTLKGEASTHLAKLSALSGDPQSDDLAKQWENIYQRTLEEKDRQVVEQGYVIMKLLEDIRSKDKSVHELQVTISRLGRSLDEYTAQQTKLSVIDTSTEHNQNVEALNRQIDEQTSKIEKLEHDKTLLNTQLLSKGELASELQVRLTKHRKMLSDLESQYLLVQAENDKLHVDLEKQEALSLQLKSLVCNKDSEISLLLSCRDGQMSEYVEQVQKHHHAQVEGYEGRLNVLYCEKEKADKTFRQLEGKFKTLQVKTESSRDEKEQLVARLETVKGSLTALQMEKERLMSHNKVLEVQHRNFMKEKECLIKENLNEHGSLKKEIKTLLHQMDDLNSENAMLKAQLIRYREDLNQVLSLKDNQLKKLLQKQQDSIKNIMSQKTSVENKLREALVDLQKQDDAKRVAEAQNANLASQVQELQAEVLALKKEKAEMNETKVISDLQEAVAAKAAECNDLQQKIFAQKMASDDLKREVRQLEGEAKRELTEASKKWSHDVGAFKREMDLLRNERETAENRVAELARDLMQTEQLLSEARSQAKATVSQNESLAKAMSALQDDRDHLIEDFKILRNKYDDELRGTKAAVNKCERQLSDAAAELVSLTKERYILTQKLSAFESNDTHARLTKQIDELCRVVSEKEAELSRVSLENDVYSKQIAAFSGSMASLQDDRDRLIQEVAKAKRGFESRQGTRATTTTPVGNEEISLRHSFDALDTEREKLLKEVKSLRCENAELPLLRLRCDELQRALQEAQAYRQRMEVDTNRYQAELAQLKSENSRLVSECHGLMDRHVNELAEQLGEAQKLNSIRGPQATHPVKESVAPLGKEPSAEQLPLVLAEQSRLQHDLQRCLQEIHQRDLRFQQLNAKLLQTLEEKMGLSSQLKTVSQTLRDTQLNLGELQNRCYWLERQIHTLPRQPYEDHAPGLVMGEVPPGAPQEQNIAIVEVDGIQTSELRNRLTEVEQQLDAAQRDVTQLNESLAEERARRQAVEDALGLAEERVKSLDANVSRATSREFTIQLESDEEREALVIDPTENIVTRKMKGGALLCKRWLRGRSLYCSRLLMSRAKSRYLFLAYLLTLHVIIFMCLAGSL